MTIDAQATPTTRPPLGERFRDALAYAASLHEHQVRKGTSSPYVSHLLAVCAIALEHDANEDEAIAALLHDAIEDAPATIGAARVREQIQERYGPVVLAIVEGCTDADTTPKPPWRPRKQQYLEHLATAPDAVLLVSASDKLHNARAVLADYRELGESLWSRFKGGRESLWYYRAVADTYNRVMPARLSGLAREVERTVAELETSAAAITTSATNEAPNS